MRRAAAAVASTVGGLYIILTQDLSHGASHDDAHHEKHEEVEEEEAPAEEESKDESTDQTNVEAPKEEKSDANAEDSSKDEAEKSDNQEEGNHSESREKKAEDKKAEHKDAKAQASQEKVDDENEASPDKSDKVGLTECASLRLGANRHSPTLARSPRASTRPLASSRACPTTTPTTRRRSPSSPRSPRRVRVLLRLPSSRALSPLTDPVLRTRRSAASPPWTRTRKQLPHPEPPTCPCHLSTLATYDPLVAICIVLNQHYSSVHVMFLHLYANKLRCLSVLR
jgi:DNA polymerase III gamma/tau subunit